MFDDPERFLKLMDEWPPDGMVILLTLVFGTPGEVNLSLETLEPSHG